MCSAHFDLSLRGRPIADERSMDAKRTVYILKNGQHPPRYYVGLTHDLRSRLDAHNRGGCRHTASFRPWTVDCAIKFPDERRAIALERYLKSGSGVVFAQRHLR